MTVELPNDEQLIDELLQYAKAHPFFDPSFVESCGAGLEKYNRLTEKQRSSLGNIYRKFRVYEHTAKMKDAPNA